MREVSECAAPGRPCLGDARESVWVSVGGASPGREPALQLLECQAERAEGIPPGLVEAVALAESGRWLAQEGTTQPWPWTITAGSESFYFESKQEALRKVREEARRKGDQDWQNAQLSPGQVKAIDEVSDAYARQADSLREAQQVQDLQRDVLKGAFSDLRSALDDGKLDWQDFANVASNALERVTFDVFTLDLERIGS